MKTILKMIGGLIFGSVVGLFIGLSAAVIFSDKTWAEAVSNVMETDFQKLVIPIVWMIVGLVVGIILQIIVHEGGHLVAGLLTGYRFVSFRIFSFTLIKQDGRFQWRRFSLAGTGGQCLMAPPLRPLSEIDTRWYNLGGVLSNLILSTLSLLIFLYADLPEGAELAFLMLTIIGYVFALTNGIPLKVGGINNDGYNLFYLEKSPHDKQTLCNLLEANALIQNGVQLKDMPESMFLQEEPIDWKDGVQVNWQMMVIARLENQHRWDDVYVRLNEAMAEKKHIVGLFMKELSLEMVFVSLVLGRIDEARELYTKDLRKYVKQFLKTQSSKQRIHFAVTLLLDNNREDAIKIFDDLNLHRQDYLMQGEVDMDIDMMNYLLKKENS